jgi:hypothetical protein
LGLVVNTAHWLTLVGTVAVVGAGGCSHVDDRPAEWDYISPAIFQPNCATTSCHSPAAAVAGLDFSTPANGYASLTRLWTWVPYPADAGPPSGLNCATENGTLVCEEMERPLVTPYDPASSRVVNMLRARDAPRMPPDRPLPELDIELVERWILNGACSSDLSCPGDASVSTAVDAAADGARDSATHAATDAATDRRAGQ